MDQPIRIPRNLTALLQLIQRQVTAGAVYWTSDVIPIEKLGGFIERWQPAYHLRADPPARAYRKRTHKASVHLVVHPDYFDTSNSTVRWWMLSTAGGNGLVAVSGPKPGPVSDCRTLSGRLRCGDYELLQQEKAFTDKSGKVKTVTSWTWRIAPGRYREWEALLVERAKMRDLEAIHGAFACLRSMPMFAGIRLQVQRLAVEANKMSGKVGGQRYELPDLPIMRMVKLWRDDGEV
jgi:hypothetical protein